MLSGHEVNVVESREEIMAQLAEARQQGARRGEERVTPPGWIIVQTESGGELYVQAACIEYVA